MIVRQPASSRVPAGKAIFALVALWGLYPVPLNAQAAELRCKNDSKCTETAERAQVAFKDGAYLKSISLYQEAYSLVPEAQLLLWTGRAHQKLCQLDRARAYFERFKQLEPNSPPEFADRLRRYEAELANPVADCILHKATPNSGRTEQASTAAQPRSTADGQPPGSPTRKKTWLWVLIGGLSAGAILGVGLGVGLKLQKAGAGPDIVPVPLER